MTEIKSWFESSYIRLSGKIFPGGIIKTLQKGVPDPINTWNENSAGLSIHSQQLVRYANNRFQAIVDMENEQVKVVEKKSRKIVKRIPFDDMTTATVWVCKVSQDGWLSTIGSNHELFDDSFSDRMFQDFFIHSLQKASRGKKPDRFDNGVFVQVPVGKIGQSVIEVKINDELHKVFTIKKGKPIKCRASKPLSYKKWDPTNPLAKWG